MRLTQTHIDTHRYTHIHCQHVTAAARNGLRWQVSSELKAKGSETGSGYDCGSVDGFVLHFVLYYIV